MDDELTYAEHGAQRFRGLAESEVTRIEAALSKFPAQRAGIRLYGVGALTQRLGAAGSIGGVAAAVIGAKARPVRAILFNKTAETNWTLGWHQDRTIAVASRVEMPGFGPWTLKSGILHVVPPFDILAGMVTLRIHLDPVSAGNAPLLIAPGSHRFGRVAEQDIDRVVARCGTALCEAERCDVWLYATAILHASEAAREPCGRRVLQVDYAARELPGGLQWLGL